MWSMRSSRESAFAAAMPGARSAPSTAPAVAASVRNCMENPFVVGLRAGPMPASGHCRSLGDRRFIESQGAAAVRGHAGRDRVGCVERGRPPDGAHMTSAIATGVVKAGVHMPDACTGAVKQPWSSLAISRASFPWRASSSCHDEVKTQRCTSRHACGRGADRASPSRWPERSDASPARRMTASRRPSAHMPVDHRVSQEGSA